MVKKKGNVKKETKSFLIAAKISVIRINYIESEIDKTQQNSKHRLCENRCKRLIA